MSYRSKTFQFETPSPFLDQKGYALVDASLVWKSDGGVTIGAPRQEFARQGISHLGLPVPGGQSGHRRAARAPAPGNVIPSLGREGVVTAFYGNPRQVFLSLGYKF